jgi:hypothetical protein
MTYLETALALSPSAPGPFFFGQAREAAKRLIDFARTKREHHSKPPLPGIL